VEFIRPRANEQREGVLLSSSGKLCLPNCPCLINYIFLHAVQENLTQRRKRKNGGFGSGLSRLGTDVFCVPHYRNTKNILSTDAHTPAMTSAPPILLCASALLLLDAS
jgi:hypothetical protein